jgi:hypothetical protein
MASIITWVLARVAAPDALPVLVLMKSPDRMTCMARNDAARMLS